MLSICSDIDRTTMPTFRNLHRFLNTEEKTPMGHGVGLDVADSLWVFKIAGNRTDISLIEDHQSLTQESYANELAHYAHSGWIDTLHTYGNFTTYPDHLVFERRFAEMAITELQRRDIRLPVWVNHGSDTNVQNFGQGEPQLGDIPGTAAYHTDLLAEYGTRFCWNHANGRATGLDDPLEPLILRDGRRMWGFSRYTSATGPEAMKAFEQHPEFFATHPALKRRWGEGQYATMVWWPALLDAQLADAVLDGLVAAGQFCIVGQHLGDLSGGAQLPTAALETFRELRRRQDAAEILVARTSRLLEYRRVWSHLRFRTRSGGGQLHIEIDQVADPVLGTFVPTLDELRGITFSVPDPATAVLVLNGRGIPGRELIRSPSGAGEPVVGVRWFDADVTDHVLTFGPELVELSRAVALRHDAGRGTGYTRASQFAERKFSAGLEYYQRNLRRIGFADRRRVIDVGSGAGHWSVALATQNDEVVAVEPDRAFVEVSAHMASRHGVEDRVMFVEGRVEDQALFDPESFDLVFCHGVLTLTDQEAALSRISRWTAEGGLFYCGDTTSGVLARDVMVGLSDGKAWLLENGLDSLLRSARARAGLGGGHGVIAFSREEMLDACALLGFQLVGSPGIQEGPRAFHGWPATFDVILRRQPGRPLAELLADEPGGKHWWAQLRRMVDAGLPSLALEALESTSANAAAATSGADETAAADIDLRARLRRGEPIDGQRSRLDSVSEPDRSLLTGMSLQLTGQYEAALEAYGGTWSQDPYRATLALLCLLDLERYDDVLSHAPATRALDHGLTEFALETAALLRARGPQAARRPAIELLSRRRDAGHADTAEVDALIGRLS